MTQFAMVEELAFLIKDNLPCKHLILSMEDAFVNFLQNDSSSDEVMELEPMNPYNRLLMHRLADIFGFAHESVGEGDDRHLILERCPETSIPSILVSDILWQFDESESPIASHQLMRRTDNLPDSKMEKNPRKYSLLEREAAYRAARERIFSVEESETREYVKQRPRAVPVVARRMIVHALGKKISPRNEEILLNGEGYKEPDTKSSCHSDNVGSNMKGETYQETDMYSSKHVNFLLKTVGGNSMVSDSSSHSGSFPHGPMEKKTANRGVSQTGTKGSSLVKADFKEQHLAAARRIFAHALGRQTAKNGFPKSDAAKLMKGM